MLAWALASSLAPALVLVFLTAIVEGPAMAAVFSVRQQRTPMGLQAQVMGTLGSVQVGAFAIGAGLGGLRSEAGEDAREHLELLARELLEEALLNGLEVAGLCLANQREAGRREVRLDSTRVIRRRAPLDEVRSSYEFRGGVPLRGRAGERGGV